MYKMLDEGKFTHGQDSFGFERTLEACVYIARASSEDTEVLLQYRHIPPYEELWIPLVGQISTHESPYDSAAKEMAKVGITASDVRYKGLVTELCPEGNWQCFLFLYVAFAFEGEILYETKDGRLEWVRVSELAKLPKPEADSYFNMKFLNPEERFYEAVMLLDGTGKMLSVRELS